MTKESNTAHDDAVSTTTAASQSTEPTTDAHEALNALDSLQTLKTLNTDRERLAKRSEQGLQTINMRSTPIFALTVFVYWGIGLMFGGHFYSDVSYIVIMTTLALIIIAAIVIMARYQKTTGISLFTMAPHGRTAFRDHRFAIAWTAAMTSQLLLPWAGFAWGFFNGHWVGAIVLAILCALVFHVLDRWYIREYARISKLPVFQETETNER